ncbi:MAG: carbohydrate ABC transporter permease [Actinomyces sp.]|jgi:sn-glycerol 3-phosphate transport system permease protein|nr:carbohydrate ABC transporter permease [Actinomyces sp.]MCI1642347.1 carbohydrate ABC transporter permease [Actinomyces sp.]MCI1662685.1 carbohydrate ABC transporter permease [Actinomyces sp.]MCI1691491.1 carbohydrate ABC transporter permease [Actinomyces sp.]MCI1787328.1 carbohydrate ABC transporter permease [Actinomyces sp.]MCI1830852.1 carbohydrate ABC transporter permease [Actinomyces sp.]
MSAISDAAAPGRLAGPAPVPGRRAASRRPAWTRAFSRANLAETLLAGYVPMILAIIVIALPLVWMAISSFKPVSEIVTTDASLLPRDPTLRNYAEVAARVPLARVFLNSVIVTGIGSAVKVVLAITGAYALVFLTRVPLRRAFLVAVLVALMVPPEASLLPNYITIASMGGRNTLWGIILPGLGTAFGTFLLRQQFLTLPAEILEAAQLDGAGHWRRLWRIVVPIMAPSIATVALVTVVSEWNAFLWPLIITDTPEYMTLPVGLNLLNSIEGQTGSYGILMAGAVLVIAPVLLVFAALQRYIVAGLTQGAVK